MTDEQVKKEDIEEEIQNEDEPEEKYLTPEEIQEVMAKYDRESATRVFEGNKAIIVSLALMAFTVIAVIINTVHRIPVQQHRALFLAMVLFLAFILYPYKKMPANRNKHVPWYDMVLACVSSASFMYMVVNYENIVSRAGDYETIDLVIAIVAILLLFEACRRVVGIPILVVVLLFIAYAYFGKYIPGYFGHRGYSVTRIVSHLYYTTEGIIGTPLGVCSTFIFLFILFGAFLERTGIGQFFIDIANSIAGKATGGPAKVAVIASALQGTITGSSVANTVSSGSFTIPMMRKMGYRPEFAAAVEAAASTGGQIMPPIMGAAAFLMAEMTGISYSTIIVAAIVPAILYFSGIMIMIHLEAKKRHLKGLPADEIPHFGKLMLHYWHLLIPLVVLVAMLVNGSTPARAAVCAIILSIVVSMFRADTRMTFRVFCGALEAGARNIIGVGIACAVAGIIVGMVTLTGLGLKLAAGLLSLSGGHLLIALFFTMIASIILGMGVPTTANYVIMASITAPIVLQLGVPKLAAHMFVFYFGIVADITPPVALAAYAGSAIAHSNPLKTGVTATKLAIAAFIVPYIFALNPSMLLVDATIPDIISVVLSSMLGMFSISIAMEGYMITHASLITRAIALVAGLTLVIPGIVTDIIGMALIGVVVVLQITRKRFEAKHGDIVKRPRSLYDDGK